jgi:hypothetical protein
MAVAPSRFASAWPAEGAANWAYLPADGRYFSLFRRPPQSMTAPADQKKTT